MKSRLPDGFILFTRQYTLSSMLKAVIWKAFDMFSHPEKSTLGPFAKRENNIIVVQTWLIDMVYELCSLDQYGSAEMTPDKLKILIGLFNDYFQRKEHALQGLQFEERCAVTPIFGQTAAFSPVRNVDLGLGFSLNLYNAPKYICASNC